MNPSIRRAQPEDADDLGSIHVQSWQKAYCGLISQDYLNKLTISGRQAMWSNQLAKHQKEENIFVIELDKKIRGFIVFTSPAMKSLSKVAEIDAINIDPQYWNQGLGSFLLEKVSAHLKEKGFDQVILWTLPTNNRAIRFYESQHWKSTGNKRMRDLFGITLEEICYCRSI